MLLCYFAIPGEIAYACVLTQFVWYMPMITPEAQGQPGYYRLGTLQEAEEKLLTPFHTREWAGMSKLFVNESGVVVKHVWIF